MKKRKRKVCLLETYRVYEHSEIFRKSSSPHHDPKSWTKLPSPDLGDSWLDECAPSGANCDVADPQFEPSGAIGPVLSSGCGVTKAKAFCVMVPNSTVAANAASM